MPTAPPHPCREPGCPNITTEARCPEHGGSSDNRGSAASRGYGGTWRRLRVMFLRKNPLCAFCGHAATEVDHIVPIRAEPGMRLEWENLRALCKPCHSRRTASER